MAFSPTGRTLATAHTNRTIQIWDVASGKELSRYEGFESSVGALAFSADVRWLASGHADSTILIWDVSAARPLKSAQPPTKGELERSWQDLAGEDGRLAHSAIGHLAAAGEHTLAL